MSSKPLLFQSPLVVTGGNWQEWIDHLKASRLSTSGTPTNKKELYVAELHTRAKRDDEDWASFSDALRVLSDRAYADLEERARERLALNQILSQIENPQVAFGVKQKRPQNVEEAVTATIELESYLRSSGPITECLIDTGAAVSLLSVNVWQRVAGYCRVLPPIEKWTGQTLVGVNGSALSVKGVAGLPLSLEGNIFNVPFVVTDDILVEAILGLDFVESNHCVIDCGHRNLTFPSRRLSLKLLPQGSSKTEKNIAVGLILTQKVTIPPASEMEIMAALEDTTSRKGTWIVEARQCLYAYSIQGKNHCEASPKDRTCYGIWFARIPHARREEVRKLLQDMLAKGAIQPSDSPWSSPIVLVTKKDGSTRFCVIIESPGIP
eukprot:Em0289g3a